MTTPTPWWRGERGEWAVVVQTLLLAILLFAPASLPGLPPWPAGGALLFSVAGIALMATGLGIAVAGSLQLGSSLTPLPHPRADATLVVSGLYRFVRHPIYFGILVLALGWAVFRQGWLTLAYTALLAIFFDIKSRREEFWLLQRYPDYAAYRQRIRKLIPFLY